MVNNKIFQYVLTAIILLASCTKAPDDINVTPDTAQKGMIQGTVLAPTVENNMIVWNGLKGATVTLIGTEYLMTTMDDGIYSFDSIPTGNYIVKAIASNYRSNAKTVVVNRQSTSTVPEIDVTPDLYTVILHGHIYETDQSTPFGNKTVMLYRSDYSESTGEYTPSTFVSSTITSNTGEFAFMESSYENYMLCSDSGIEIRWINPDSPITGSSTSSGGIVEKNAYIHLIHPKI